MFNKSLGRKKRSIRMGWKRNSSPQTVQVVSSNRAVCLPYPCKPSPLPVQVVSSNRAEIVIGKPTNGGPELLVSRQGKEDFASTAFKYKVPFARWEVIGIHMPPHWRLATMYVETRQSVETTHSQHASSPADALS
jgi:hypothetical protein